MPVELLENVIAIGDDPFSQTVAPAGNVSIWCVHEGASADGFKSADQVMQQGLPFGHGDRRAIKGFQVAMVPQKGGKPRPNTVKGPMGRTYVELYSDEASFTEKQVFEANISNQAVRNAQGSVSMSGDDPDIKGVVTKSTDEIRKLTDDEIDALAEKQLKSITQDAP